MGTASTIAEATGTEIAEGMVTETVVGMVTETVVGMVTETAVSTKNGIKRHDVDYRSGSAVCMEGGPVSTKLVVTLRMLVRPERRRALLETIRGMLEPARVERGCLSYRLYEDVEDRNAFVLLEEWATQEDLERHIAKDNQRRLLGLMDFLIEQPEFRFNTVSHTEGMDLIENVLKTDDRTGSTQAREA